MQNVCTQGFDEKYFFKYLLTSKLKTKKKIGGQFASD